MIMVIVAAVIILGIVGYVVMGKSKTAPAGIQNAPAAQQEGNVITSIKDALSKSMSLKCEYSDASGSKTTAYIKNGMVRADVAGETDSAGSVIIKDKKMYFWNEQGGFMIDMPEMDVTPAPGSNTSQQQGQNTIADLEKYKDNCKTAVVADSLFTPPSDVKFQDMSKLMSPSGTKTAPTGTMNQGQIDEMMKKYQTTQ